MSTAEVFPLPGPSPGKVRFTLPLSTSSTSFHADISDAGSECDSTSSCGDSSDDRVFFGSPKAAEGELIARLSGAAVETPRKRLRKRDSREFMRRQTLLPPSTPSEAGSTGDEEPAEKEGVESPRQQKVWPGGFFERRASAGEDEQSNFSPSSSTDSSPSRAPVTQLETPYRQTREAEDHCDLTLDFSRFRVSDSPLSTLGTRLQEPPHRQSLLANARSESKSDVEASPSEASEEDWSEGEGEDSDKENAPAPIEGIVEEEVELEEYPLFEGPLTGKISYELDDDEALLELDMGGLRLSDFADPEIDFGPVLTTTSFASSPDNSDVEASDDERPKRALRLSSNVEAFSALAEADVLREEVAENDEQPEESEIVAPLSPSPTRLNLDSELAGPPQNILTSASEGREVQTGDDSPESPLPLGRAGPVVIPRYSHLTSIRAEEGSPFRSFTMEVPLATTPPSFPSEPTLRGHLLGSGSSPTRSPGPASDASTPTSRLHAAVTMVYQPKQALKSSTLASAIGRTISPSKRDLSPAAAVARSEAIKAQFSAVFAGAASKKLGLGAPQRSVSVSSQSSGTSAPSRPGSRMAMTAGSSSSTARPVKDKGKTATAGMEPRAIAVPGDRTKGVSGSKIPQGSQMSRTNGLSVSQSKMAPSAPVGFVRKAPTVSQKPVRPALAPRALPPTQPQTSQRVTAAPATSKAFSSATATTGSQGLKSHRLPFTAQAKPQPQPQTIEPVRASPTSQPNPLKRPLATAFQPSGRSAIAATGGARNLLGPAVRVIAGQVHTHPSSRPAFQAPAPVSPSMADSVFGPTVPEFSLGVISAGLGPSSLIRSGLGRSPGRASGPLAGGAVKGTPMSTRINRFGTPSRKIGTPSRTSGTPGRNRPNAPPILVYSVVSTTSGKSAADGATAPRDVGAVAASPTKGPPSTNTRHTFEASGPGVSAAGHRGSSEDHEEVSFALPAGPSSSDVGSSPVKTPNDDANTTSEVEVEGDPDKLDASKNRAEITSPDSKPKSGAAAKTTANAGSTPPSNSRPKRATKPPSRATAPLVPSISEKELKAKTALNTARNEKYTCAIDRQVVRKEGPRPASPTSKIPTTEQREEEAKKREREKRARRRKGEAGDDATEEELPVIQRLEGLQVTWRGDDEPWATPGPERPSKKARTSGPSGSSAGAAGSGREGGKRGSKSVKWDKGIVVIRHDGRPVEPHSTGTTKKDGLGSALSTRNQIELDKFGNVLATRPRETLRPHKVVVHSRVYEGEEPEVPATTAPVPPARSKKKGGAAA